MEPQQPTGSHESRGDSNPESGAKHPPAAVSARRYPTPPPLPIRLIMLCLRPESWAEAARYPTRFTAVPLVLAILIAGAAVGLGEASRILFTARHFAAQYDTYYPPLEYHADGTLRATRDLPEPIRFGDAPGPVLTVDPTGKTSPESLKTLGFFISDKDVWLKMGNGAPMHVATLATLFPPDRRTVSAVGESSTTVPAMVSATGAPPIVINSESLKRYIAQNAVFMVVLTTMNGVLLMGAANSLWAILMMLLICPLVLLGAAGPRFGDGPDRRLILPRRAAYRMAAAVLVPLIIFGGIMHAVGKPIAGLIGFEASTLFWFFAACGLALWTGILAKRLFAPSPSKRAT